MACKDPTTGAAMARAPRLGDAQRVSFSKKGFKNFSNKGEDGDTLRLSPCPTTSNRPQGLHGAPDSTRGRQKAPEGASSPLEAGFPCQQHWKALPAPPRPMQLTDHQLHLLWIVGCVRWQGATGPKTKRLSSSYRSPP